MTNPETDLGYFKAIPMVVFDTSTLTGTYQAINPGGFPHSIKILKIINMGTLGITISYDGQTLMDYYPGTPAGTNPIPMIINLQTNHSCNSSYSSGTLTGRQGQVIYGLGTAGTGNLYIVGYY